MPALGGKRSPFGDMAALAQAAKKKEGGSAGASPAGPSKPAETQQVPGSPWTASRLHDSHIV
jgi:hypothetical protein